MNPFAGIIQKSSSRPYILSHTPLALADLCERLAKTRGTGTGSCIEHYLTDADHLWIIGNHRRCSMVAEGIVPRTGGEA